MDMKLNKEKLKRLRESKAWSQSHLAEVSDISLRTIQRIEKSGVASPESIKSICAAYEVQVSEVLAGIEAPLEKDRSLSSVMRLRISSMDIKATLIASIIAFAIAYFTTKPW